jgi:serine/threonine-protein kinase
LLHALRLAALARLFSGDAPAAEPLFRELVDLSQQRFPDAPAWQITPLVHLAETQARLARVEDAEGNFRRAWELSKRINGEFNADALQTQAKLGGYLHSTGRRAEGRAMLFAALHALGREKGNDAPNTVGTINFYLGTALTADGHFNDAQKFLAAEADDLRQHYPQSQPLARVMVAQADLFTALGRYREARALLDESDAIAKAVTLDVPGYAGNLARFTRARLLLAQEHADEALAVLEAVAIPPFGPSAALPIDEVVKNLLQAGAHAALGQTETAAAESRAALETVQRSPVHRYFAGFESEASLLLGQALRRQGELAASRLSLERALTLREAFDDSRSPWLAQAQIELAKCHADLHQRQPAQRLLAEARSILAGQIELGRQFREPLRDLQKRLGSPSG